MQLLIHGLAILLVEFSKYFVAISDLETAAFEISLLDQEAPGDVRIMIITYFASRWKECWNNITGVGLKCGSDLGGRLRFGIDCGQASNCSHKRPE